MVRDISEALNENVFPASLVRPGHGSAAALKAQTAFMNLTAFDGHSAECGGKVWYEHKSK